MDIRGATPADLYITPKLSTHRARRQPDYLREKKAIQELAGRADAAALCRSGGAVLMVHELATNAVKYGALASDARRISITWAATDDDPPVRGLPSRSYPDLLARFAGRGSHCQIRVKTAAARPEIR